MRCLRELYAGRCAAAIRYAQLGNEEIPRLVVGIDHTVCRGGEEISDCPAQIYIAAPIRGTIFYAVVSYEITYNPNMCIMSSYQISILVDLTYRGIKIIGGSIGIIIKKGICIV